jgi:hypothetical protein
MVKTRWSLHSRATRKRLSHEDAHFVGMLASRGASIEELRVRFGVSKPKITRALVAFERAEGQYPAARVVRGPHRRSQRIRKII